MRPDTTFDKPLFPLIPDTHERKYANVDNMLAISGVHVEATRAVPIVVPTVLFTLMRETFKVPVEDEVTLYLVQEGEFFVFGMAWGAADINVADLWAYTNNALPNFLK